MIIKSIVPYTRFVKSAKLLLGVLVLILTALIFIYPIVKKGAAVRIAFSSMEKSDVAPTKMVNANFRGFDENNQPYTVTADTATQIDENNIDFEKINGDIALNTGKWLSIKANKGHLQVPQKILSLTGDVEMFSDDGYTLRSETMKVDINTKTATTEDAVAGQGTIGTLKSQGAVFQGNQRIALFKKPVHVTLYLSAPSHTKE